MIVDVHAHYQLRDGFLDDLVDVCAKRGVDKVCLNGGGEIWNQHDNDEVLRAAQRCPDLIVPFYFVKLGEAHVRAADIDAAVRAGFRGLKTQNPLANYDDPAYFPFYEKAEKHEMVWLMHTGVTARYPSEKAGQWKGPGRVNVSSDRMRPVRLDAVARAFPGLTLVAAHLGHPWYSEAAFLALFNPNLYLDLAGVDLTNKLHPSLLVFKDLFWGGPKHWEKLVFGTEGEPSCYWRLDEHRALFDQHQLSEETRRKIMGDTLARLLKLAPQRTTEHSHSP